MQAVCNSIHTFCKGSPGEGDSSLGFKEKIDMALDRIQRAQVEAIRRSTGPVRLETGDSDSWQGLEMVGDAQLRHDIALSVQSYYNRRNKKLGIL